MDEKRFDQIARALGTMRGRREALQALLAGTLGGAAGVLGLDAADAKNKGKDRKDGKKGKGRDKDEKKAKGRDKDAKSGKDRGKDKSSKKGKDKDRGRGGPSTAATCSSGNACTRDNQCCGDYECPGFNTASNCACPSDSPKDCGNGTCVRNSQDCPPCTSETKPCPGAGNGDCCTGLVCTSASKGPDRCCPPNTTPCGQPNTQNGDCCDDATEVCNEGSCVSNTTPPPTTPPPTTGQPICPATCNNSADCTCGSPSIICQNHICCRTIVGAGASFCSDTEPAPGHKCCAPNYVCGGDHKCQCNTADGFVQVGSGDSATCQCPTGTHESGGKCVPDEVCVAPGGACNACHSCCRGSRCTKPNAPCTGPENAGTCVACHENGEPAGNKDFCCSQCLCPDGLCCHPDHCAPTTTTTTTTAPSICFGSCPGNTRNHPTCGPAGKCKCIHGSCQECVQNGKHADDRDDCCSGCFVSGGPHPTGKKHRAKNRGGVRGGTCGPCGPTTRPPVSTTPHPVGCIQGVTGQIGATCFTDRCQACINGFCTNLCPNGICTNGFCSGGGGGGGGGGVSFCGINQCSSTRCELCNTSTGVCTDFCRAAGLTCAGNGTCNAAPGGQTCAQICTGPCMTCNAEGKCTSKCASGTQYCDATGNCAALPAAGNKCNDDECKTAGGICTGTICFVASTCPAGQSNLECCRQSVRKGCRHIGGGQSNNHGNKGGGRCRRQGKRRCKNNFGTT